MSARGKKANQEGQIIALRLKVDHRQLIDKAAEELGLTRSSWIRMVILQAAREQVAA